MNHRLKGAMLNAELSAQGLASRVGVDVKSVSRWLSQDRVPHPLTRARVAHVLEQQETFLWPVLLDGDEARDITCAELDRIWPTRSAIPTQTWHAFFSRAAKELDILVYAGGFLLETLDLADVIAHKAKTGTKTRILVGDPDSDAVKVRAAEERLPWLPERCRTTQQYLTQVRCRPGVGVRLHGTTLYASLFRFDDLILVNQHAYGAWACQAPVHQVRRIRDGYLFDFYRAAFERAWAIAGTPETQPCQEG